jgi:hypothetical protein
VNSCAGVEADHADPPGAGVRSLAMNRIVSSVVALSFASVLASSASAVNLLTNGSFDQPLSTVNQYAAIPG